MQFSEEEAKNEGSVKDKFANHFFLVLDRHPQQATCPIEEEPPKAAPSLPFPTSTLFFPFTGSLKAFEFGRFFEIRTP